MKLDRNFLLYATAICTAQANQRSLVSRTFSGLNTNSVEHDEQVEDVSRDASLVDEPVPRLRRAAAVSRQAQENNEDVTMVNCPATISAFFTNLVFDLSTMGDALSLQDGAVVEAALVQAYNELSSELCDDTFRTIVNTDIDLLTMPEYLAPTDVSVTRVSAFVTGTCRGCDPKTNLFQAQPPTRRQLEEEQSKQPTTRQKRRLDDLPVTPRVAQFLCRCNTAEPQFRAPSPTEFLARANMILANSVVGAFVGALEGVADGDGDGNLVVGTTEGQFSLESISNDARSIMESHFIHESSWMSLSRLQ